MVCMEEIFEYFEDLPIELRDTLSALRELDLMVQNALDEKTKESKEFFRKAKSMQPADREPVFQLLMEDFGKILEDADEKVIIIGRLEALLVQRLEQLDRQIAEFKIDLEAESPGITTAIEEKVAKSDERAKTKKPKAEKRKQSTQSRKKSSASSSTSSSIDEVATAEPPIVADLPEKPAVIGTNVSLNVETTLLATGAELNLDTTRYCICNEVSYGDMIACDNQSCPREWFHYPCVNLVTAPEGSWFCPSCRPRECTVSLKKC